MDRLNYETLARQGYQGYLAPKDTPVKVLQFGEGNFLRAFVDYWFDRMNEDGGFGGRIQMVTPIAPNPAFDVCKLAKEQDGLYTLYLQGQEKGEKVRRRRVISSVAGCLNPYADFQAFLDCAKNPELRILTSNTTEAGIAYDPEAAYDQNPPRSFPGKLCRFLHERWKLGLPGFLILACELIDHNGEELKKIVLRHCDEWGLEPEFRAWVEAENTFCSTLVDRIVPGYPRVEAETLTAENGYEDKLMDTGEVFGFWVIEGPQWIYDVLPIKQAGLEEHILVVDDHTPYKQRKVRILNGAHTSFVPGAYLAGQNIVRDCMADPVIRGFMEACIYQEIMPTLTLPKEELQDFAFSVVDRFQNPYIDHQLLSICLNSTSKWRARVLPSVKGYVERKQTLPRCLTASFALYLEFYRNGASGGVRGADHYTVQDDAAVLAFYQAHKADDAQTLVNAVCANVDFWGEDLTALPGFADEVAEDLRVIQSQGAYALMRSCVEQGGKN